MTFESLTFARLVIKTEKAQTEVRIGPLDKKAARYPLSTSKENGVAWLSQSTVDSLLKNN